MCGPEIKETYDLLSGHPTQVPGMIPAPFGHTMSEIGYPFINTNKTGAWTENKGPAAWAATHAAVAARQQADADRAATEGMAWAQPDGTTATQANSIVPTARSPSAAIQAAPTQRATTAKTASGTYGLAPNLGSFS